MLMYFFMEAYNIKVILKSLGNNITFLKSLKFSLICYFFNGITPAASGGQPMEVYFMLKEKVSGYNATLALLVQMCSFKIATLCIGILSFIINIHSLSKELIILFLLGITIYFIPLILILISIFLPHKIQKIIEFFIKIIEKLGFKKFASKNDYINEKIEKYSESSAYFISNKNLFLKSIFHGFIQVSLYCLIPFFIYKSLNLSGYNILTIYSYQAMLYCMASWIPLPGAVGASEAIYISLFGSIFNSINITSALILCRGISFYLFIVIGLIVVIINYYLLKNKDKIK